jgi:hypothetical protein
LAVGKYVEASGRHYNGFVVAIIAARAAASACSASNGTDASTTHSLIGYANARPYADPEKAARRAAWPTTWNEFLPVSMPITAIAVFGVRHGVLLVFGAPCQLRLLSGQHGRTIPLADVQVQRTSGLPAMSNL